MSALKQPASPKTLLASGLALSFIFGWIAWLSFHFDSSEAPETRPLLVVLLLFGASCITYWIACCDVYRAKATGQVESQFAFGRLQIGSRLLLIVGFGILFRAIFLFSIPIQEIDIYRYIVDGATANAGIDPYEFAPSEVNVHVHQLDRFAQPVIFARPPGERSTLDDLANYFAARPGLCECVQKVHYGEYTTPYPPVSQFVFRVATAWVPVDAGRLTWLWLMKSMLILFDVLTGLLMIGLLATVRLPTTYSIVYWWCPLVLKEIANSGHLDSIAICLTVAFAWCAIKNLYPDLESSKSKRELHVGLGLASCCGVLLGLAFAAKIYPAVLGPIWAIALLRRRSFASLVPLAVCAIVAFTTTWPMVQKLEFARKYQTVATQEDSDLGLVAAETTLARANRSADSGVFEVLRRPQAGVEVFSKYWEMNDLIFMVIVENVRPKQPIDASAPWFVVTSESQRSWLVKTVGSYVDLPPHQIPFGFTRQVTLLVFSVLLVVFCWRAWRSERAVELLELFFFALAWFWLLSPTQNPWYWVWAIPFIPFVKRPVPWLVLCGLLFLYYMRFYFDQHFAGLPVWGTAYRGTLFFDFVFPWIQFAPILLWLVYAEITRKSKIATTE